MANICSFMMRVRGTKQNCMELYSNGMRQCYEWNIKHESGSEHDYILSIFGECRWSVTTSMVEDNEDDTFNGKTLCEKSRLLNLEIEVFGYDISDPEWIEHYHYKNGECLRAFNLPPYIMESQVECIEEEGIDLSKYDYINDQGIYVLKDEEDEPFEWDEERNEMQVNFRMPLDVNETDKSKGVTVCNEADTVSKKDNNKVLFSLVEKLNEKQLKTLLRESCEITDYNDESLEELKIQLMNAVLERANMFGVSPVEYLKNDIDYLL